MAIFQRNKTFLILFTISSLSKHLYKTASGCNDSHSSFPPPHSSPPLSFIQHSNQNRSSKRRRMKSIQFVHHHHHHHHHNSIISCLRGRSVTAFTSSSSSLCQSSTRTFRSSHKEIWGRKKTSIYSNNPKSSEFQLLTQNLLQSAINRASSTMSSNNKNKVMEDENVKNANVVNVNDIVKDKDTIHNDSIHSETKKRKNGNHKNNHNQQQHQGKKHKDKRQYLGNPSVTPTALAHTLWSQVILPYEDIIIDATCGNGKDTLVLAKLLFPNDCIDENEKNLEDHDTTTTTIDTFTKLIGIDIQKQACENTIQLLNDHLPSKLLENNVQIIHSSHAPLPKPTSTYGNSNNNENNVGLICYNLGYLPGSGSTNKHVSTTMITTLYSMADGALILRVGGLLSVMAYPGSSFMEFCAVKYFMEGLAMFSSKDDWRDFVDCIPDDDQLLAGQKQNGSSKMKGNGDVSDNDVLNTRNDSYGGEEDSYNQVVSVRELVKVTLERVMGEGDKKQTWRVFDHRPLGRPMSPILFTAMRIK